MSQLRIETKCTTCWYYSSVNVINIKKLPNIKHEWSLVMDGSRAQVGVDVFDTYAPIIDYSTVRLLISLAFCNHWEMFHWDISVAFTNATAEEVAYVRFPKSFPDD